MNGVALQIGMGSDGTVCAAAAERDFAEHQNRLEQKIHGGSVSESKRLDQETMQSNKLLKI